MTTLQSISEWKLILACSPICYTFQSAALFDENVNFKEQKSTFFPPTYNCSQQTPPWLQQHFPDTLLWSGKERIASTQPRSTRSEHGRCTRPLGTWLHGWEYGGKQKRNKKRKTCLSFVHIFIFQRSSLCFRHKCLHKNLGFYVQVLNLRLR